MEPVYKSCYDFIIKLQKLPDTITNEDREIFKTNSLTNRLKARYTANKLLVLDIYHKFTKEKKRKIIDKSWHGLKYLYNITSPDYVYEVGKITETNYGEAKNSYDCIDYFLEEDGAIFGTPYEINSKYFHGHLKFYDTDGILSDECTFINGKKDGDFIGYWRNGTIRMHCYYIDDEQIGDRTFYLEDGTIETNDPITDGIKEFFNKEQYLRENQ